MFTFNCFAIFLALTLKVSVHFRGALCFDVKAFDDTVLFKLNWPGEAEIPNIPGSESLLISTQNKEKYKCFLPELHEKAKDEAELFVGPSPRELLQPLFFEPSCSYRIESYWTYEVCHGRYVRQYHEEREGKKVKVQQYLLGYYDPKLLTPGLNEEEPQEKTVDIPDSQDFPVKKIEGVLLPYYQVNMTGGTFCELSDKPRVTRVLYVCYQNAKHDIYSFKETSICEYETIILSPLLCKHPKFRPQATNENIINCHAVESSPKKPRSLLELEYESLKLRQQKNSDDSSPKKTYAVFSVKVGEDGEQKVHFQILPVEVMDAEETAAPDQKVLPRSPSGASSPVHDFLSGKMCLTGGSSSWWKYEFCYGKSVSQYHIDNKDGTKTTVRLGFFDRERHFDWLTENPHKRPRPFGIRKYVSHLYTGGDICDKTGQPRQTEVKLRCPNVAKPGSVSLYLIEPKTCEYILNVESQLICELLPYADEYGLIQMMKSEDDDVTVADEDDEAPTTSGEQETADPYVPKKSSSKPSPQPNRDGNR